MVLPTIVKDDLRYILFYFFFIDLKGIILIFSLSLWLKLVCFLQDFGYLNFRKIMNWESFKAV